MQMSFTLRLLAVARRFRVASSRGARARGARCSPFQQPRRRRRPPTYNAKIPAHTFTAIDVSVAFPRCRSLTRQLRRAAAVRGHRRSRNATAVGNRGRRVREHRPRRGARHLLRPGPQRRARRHTPHGWGDLETIDPNTTDGVGTPYTVRTLAPATIIAHPLTRASRRCTGQQVRRRQPGKARHDRRRVLEPAERARPARSRDRLSHHRRGLRDPRRHRAATIARHSACFGTDFSGDFYRAWSNAFDFGAAALCPRIGRAIFAASRANRQPMPGALVPPSSSTALLRCSDRAPLVAAPDGRVAAPQGASAWPCRDAVRSPRHGGRRPPRPPDARPRHRRDAGVHAGGHLRHGQGDDARASCASSARRSSSATPSTCGCGPGLDVIARARRPAPLHGLGRADPHRLRRLPGVQPRRAAQDHARRASTFASPVERRPAVPHARGIDAASSACSTPTS